MNRRTFVQTMLAAGLASTLSGCATTSAEEALLPLPSTETVPPTPTGVPPLPGPPPSNLRAPRPIGPITKIPRIGNAMALTIDDGASSEVVGAYVQLAKDTQARLTFFVTGYYNSWTDNATALRPLVESGQIQLGNHSWDHPAFTKLSSTGVADQFRRCQDFLKNTYGVDGTPYYRPPFGYHNAEVDRVAADFGYSVPTMWEGSLSDSGVVTEQHIEKMALQYFNPGALVIGHANHPPVTHVYRELCDIIRQRELQLVTLNDVFET